MSAIAFNQDLSGWNVHSGNEFVCNMTSICLLVWLCFQVGFRLESIPDVWLLMEQAISHNCAFHFFLVLEKYV
jgi:hypothetical protein